MNPDRIRSHHRASTDPAADVLADAVAMVDRTDHAGTRRGHRPGPPNRRRPVAGAAAADRRRRPPRGCVGPAAGRSGRRAAPDRHLGRSHRRSRRTRGERRGLVIQVTADGRVRLPHAGLDLVAVGLTSDEALGCAALLAAADDLDDTAIPERADADGWRTFANEAGAIRPRHTQPRTPADSDQRIPRRGIEGDILDPGRGGCRLPGGGRHHRGGPGRAGPAGSGRHPIRRRPTPTRPSTTT